MYIGFAPARLKRGEPVRAEYYRRLQGKSWKLPEVNGKQSSP
jgi:hypothetical protein